MKFFKRTNTVFFRLIVSFASLSIVIITVLSISSYLVFSSVYRNEIGNANQLILDNIKKNIETKVINRVQQIYVGIIFGQGSSELLYVFNNPIEGNHHRLFKVYNYMFDTYSYNADIVDSIMLYMPDKGILVSTPGGLKYTYEMEDNVYMPVDEKNMGTLNGWIYGFENPVHSANSPSVLYITSYPRVFSDMKRPGYIAIYVKQSFIKNTISELISEIKGDTFVINPEGKIISGFSDEAKRNELENSSFIEKVIADKGSSDSFIVEINELKSIVSFTDIGNTGWKLVSYSSVDDYYRKTAVVRRMFIISGILALFVGFVLTRTLASRIYKPLHGVVDAVKNLVSEKKFIENVDINEYVYINNAIGELKYRIENMQVTISENKPFLKLNYIISLLNGRINSRKEYDDYVKILNLDLKHKFYTAVMFELDIEKLQKLSRDKVQEIINDVLNEIAYNSDENVIYLPADLSFNRICTIVNIDVDNKDVLREMIIRIQRYLRDKYMVESIAAIGRYLKDPLELRFSKDDIETLLKYRYFQSENLILDDLDLLYRESNKEHIPKTLIERFALALNSRDLTTIKSVIEEFTEMAKHGKYSADYCHMEILQYLKIFSVYAREMKYDSSADESGIKSISVPDDLSNVDKFSTWFIKAINDVFDFVEEKNKHRSAEKIEIVKTFIENHLSEELSLDMISEVIGYNPQYISKLFKCETGVNFVDYINEKRIEKARQLLMTTDLTVSDISKKVGYSASGYLIRQFKKIYGETPANYKIKKKPGYDPNTTQN